MTETKSLPRTQFLGSCFHQLTLAETTAYLQTADRSSPFSYIVTPNVDHIIRLNDDDARDLRAAYEACVLSLCDSRILRTMARLAGVELPLVPGSDLTKAMFRAVLDRGDRIGVIGMNQSGMEKLRALYPDLVIDHIEPPFGFLENREEVDRIVAFVESEPRRFYFFAVGSPRSEIVARMLAERGRSTRTGDMLRCLVTIHNWRDQACTARYAVAAPRMAVPTAGRTPKIGFALPASWPQDICNLLALAPKKSAGLAKQIPTEAPHQ